MALAEKLVLSMPSPLRAPPGAGSSNPLQSSPVPSVFGPPRKPRPLTSSWPLRVTVPVARNASTPPVRPFQDCALSVRFEGTLTLVYSGTRTTWVTPDA